MSTATTQRRAALARGGSIGFLGAAASAVLGFVLTVVLTRLLGAGGAGVVMQATGVFAITVAFAKFGLDSTALYLLPRVRLDSPDHLRAVTRRLLLLAASVALTLTVVVEAAVPLVWADRAPQTVDAIRAALAFVPAGALMLVASGILRALGSVTQYVAVANIALPALRPPAVAVAAVATGSLVAVTVAWALPLVVTLAAALLLVHHRLTAVEAARPADAAPTDPPAAARTRAVVGFALPRTLSAALEQGLQWVDVLLLGLLLGSGAAGVYGGASRFVQTGMVVDTALRVVVSPQFSALLHEGDEEALEDTYTTATVWLVLFAAPIYVLLAVFAPVVLALLGPEFVAGAGVLTVLALGCTVTFLAGNIHTLLLMSGRSGWAAGNKAVVLAVNVAANLVLLPRLGMIGAALAWAACMILDACLAAIEVRVLLGVRPGVLAALEPLAVVAVAVGGPALAARAALGATLTGLVVGSATAAGVFLLAVWALRGRLRLEGLVHLARRRRS